MSKTLLLTGRGPRNGSLIITPVKKVLSGRYGYGISPARSITGWFTSYIWMKQQQPYWSLILNRKIPLKGWVNGTAIYRNHRVNPFPGCWLPVVLTGAGWW